MRSLFCLLLIALFSVAPYSRGEESTSGQQYVDLYPPFIVNFGGKGRLRFFKAEVTVRLVDPSDAVLVENHMPYIRNDLVLLFSKQDSDTLSSREGKEKLRQDAMQAVKDILKQEEDNEVIDNLLFTNFIIQK